VPAMVGGLRAEAGSMTGHNIDLNHIIEALQTNRASNLYNTIIATVRSSMLKVLIAVLGKTYLTELLY